MILLWVLLWFLMISGSSLRSSSLSQYPSTLLGRKHLWSETSVVSYWNLPSEWRWNNCAWYHSTLEVPTLDLCQASDKLRSPDVRGLPLWRAGFGYAFTNQDFLFVQTWILWKTRKGLWLRCWVWTSEWCHWSVWSLGKPTRRIFVCPGLFEVVSPNRAFKIIELEGNFWKAPWTTIILFKGCHIF